MPVILPKSGFHDKLGAASGFAGWHVPRKSQRRVIDGFANCLCSMYGYMDTGCNVPIWKNAREFVVWRKISRHCRSGQRKWGWEGVLPDIQQVVVVPVAVI